MTKSPSDQSNTRVELNLHMDVPVHQQIRYAQNFLEKANAFWYQVLALVIPSYFIIIELILGGAFRRRILNSVEWSEIKHVEEQKRGKQHYLQAKYDF